MNNNNIFFIAYSNILIIINLYMYEQYIINLYGEIIIYLLK